MSDTSSADIHFFISYTGTDQAWAEWVAWQLEHKGYRVLIQAWDFKSGGVFPGDMHRALQQSARVIAILTPAYMKSGFCQPEWQAAFAEDPTGEKGVLVCVRVEDFKPDGLLRGRSYIDLVKLSQKDASERLLSRLENTRAKPASAPGFPGSSTAPVPVPVFPGSTTTTVLKTSIPHNLPALQPFFGRDDELLKIADALDPDSRTWGALIDGPGGMGKTSLAVRAAYAASPTVFKKIVFVSLKTRELDDDGLRDLSGFILSGLAELFGELARQLGHDDVLKAAEEQRPRLLLDALRGTQSLLILDNLESLLKPDRDTVFTFVKKLPTGCKAILTCRGRIGSGAEELILEKLSEVAALATLAELATHNPQLAKTTEAERHILYCETAGKPLLLRWTAGQLGRGHCLTFTDAISYLRSCPEGNDPLEFIFGDLVEDFTEAETCVICALTYFTLPAKVEHIAAIVGLEPAVSIFSGHPPASTPGPVTKFADIDRALSSLVNRSLAVPSDELTAFSLVPMVADFLRRKKPDVIAETGARLDQRAYVLILENGRKKHERFPVLEDAWPALAPALPRFLTGPNKRLQAVCDALDRFLDFTGRWDEWLALSQEAEAKAIAESDFDSAGRRAFQAGWVHHLRGEADAVLAYAGRAAAHWEQAYPPGSGEKAGVRERAFAISLRGLGHRWKEDYPAAIAAYRDALVLHRRLSAESASVAVALNDLATAEHSSGDFIAAEQDYREALNVAHGVHYAEGIATYTGNLASLALDRNDWPRAEALAREALPLAEKLGRQELIASIHDCLAEALVRQARGSAGMPHARRAVDILARLGSPELAGAQRTLRKCELADKERNQEK